MVNNTLLFFTASFPFGKGETFIENEIDIVAAQFKKVIIISNDTTSTTQRPIPNNVSVLRRPYNLTSTQKLKAVAGLFNSIFWQEIAIAKNVLKLPISKAVINTALSTLYKSHLIEQYLKQQLKLSANDSFTTYTYWSDDTAVALAMLQHKFPNMKNCCRAHRWDVYFNPSKGEYLPYRKLLANYTDKIFFISNHARKFFTDTNQLPLTANLDVSRLGTIPLNLTHDNTGKFHLVSCSTLIPRKRVLLIAQGLLQLKVNQSIKWTHFGDGEQMNTLKQFVQDNFSGNPLIEIELKGNVPNPQVRRFYEQNKVDVFINVSDSEGVPVSIMEALSAQIPVIATDVDAVNEIVISGNNGTLLSANPTAQQVADAIAEFMEMTNDQKAQYNKNAFEFWHNNYNAENNYKEFCEKLRAL